MPNWQLADTSDILNCGIDIRVSPPGKAVKTITLLSGGEKAFVAIALYFAILKLRPTPFCVLDEIEAALDDVNVQRFAKYIRRLTDSTQFIVITHRRGTMEEADMLYGVTMQEQGVSKMLMLNLAEAEKRLKIPLSNGKWRIAAMDMRSEKYPYRLDVERRLPNGSLTTDGYAARHPVEFRHWGHARGYVLWGERIDRTDWENWRINYYGK